jgi:hypothetical protein
LVRRIAFPLLVMGLAAYAAVAFRYRVVSCNPATCVRLDRWTGRAERIRVAAPRGGEAERERIRAFRERYGLPQDGI